MPLSYCSHGQSCEMFNEVLVDSRHDEYLFGRAKTGTSRSGVNFKVGDLSYFLRVCNDNINQDMTCLITLF